MSSKNIKSNRQDTKKDTFYLDLLKKRNDPALRYFKRGKFSLRSSIEGISTIGLKNKEEHSYKHFNFYGNKLSQNGTS